MSRVQRTAEQRKEIIQRGSAFVVDDDEKFKMTKHRDFEARYFFTRAFSRDTECMAAPN